MTLHTRKTWQVPLRHNSYQAARKRIGELREKKVACKRLMICKKGVHPKEEIQMGVPERWLSCRRHLYWKRTAVQGKKGYRTDRFVCHYVKMRIETGKTVSIRIARQWILCYPVMSKGQNLAIITRCLNSLFLSLGRRWLIQI